MKSRKVMIKRWLTREESAAKGFPNAIVSPEYLVPGLFLCWGSEGEDTGEQMIPTTVGIIELSGGEVMTVPPHWIQFRDFGDHTNSQIAHLISQETIKE